MSNVSNQLHDLDDALTRFARAVTIAHRRDGLPNSKTMQTKTLHDEIR